LNLLHSPPIPLNSCQSANTRNNRLGRIPDTEVIGDSQATNKGKVPLSNMLPHGIVLAPNQRSEMVVDPMMLESRLVTPHKPRLVELPSTATPIPPPELVQVAHEPLEDSQIPLMISETKQLIGCQLIKALSNFKHDMVGPLSCSTQHTSPDKDTIVVSTEGTQCCSKKLKNKIKFWKPVIKMVWDMLTKKCILFRKYKQLDDSSLKPLSASNFEAIKKLSEVAYVHGGIPETRRSEEVETNENQRQAHLHNEQTCEEVVAR
jgi:hypothetical protein